MQFTTTIATTLLVLSAGASALPNTLVARAATPSASLDATASGTADVADSGATDLASCLAHAEANVQHPTAQQGFINGCHAHFGGADLHNLTRRSHPEAFDIFGFPDRSLQKRCSDEQGSCCCFKLCNGELTCPACATGCTLSCTTQYGGDCTEGGDDCPVCT